MDLAVLQMAMEILITVLAIWFVLKNDDDDDDDTGYT